MPILHKHIKGSAIITALFVVALVAAASIAMMARVQQDIRRTQLLINATQAKWYADGSVDWAIDTLMTNLKNKKPNQVIDKTPIELPQKQIDHATVSSTIYDAEGYFNINNVTDDTSRIVFGKLIQFIAPKTSNQTVEMITQATLDWISSKGQADAFRNYYANENPPYQAPHRPLLSTSELRLIKGMTPALFHQLSPYLIALPPNTLININNAKAPLLRCLSPTLTEASANQIIQYRKQTPFGTIKQFQQFDVVKNNPFDEKHITTESIYFLIKTQVTLGDQMIILYTLVKRELIQSKPTVTVLWQSKGSI